MKKIFVLCLLLSGCITPKYTFTQKITVSEPSGQKYVRPSVEATVSLEECW
jgi:hypothetical protein